MNERIKQIMLAEIPDNGSISRKLRRWNIQNDFVLTSFINVFLFLALIAVLTKCVLH